MYETRGLDYPFSFTFTSLYFHYLFGFVNVLFAYLYNMDPGHGFASKGILENVPKKRNVHMFS